MGTFLRVLICVVSIFHYAYAACPIGTIQGLTKKQCLLYSPIAESWYDAEENCQRQGGHLASVANGFMNSFILENVGSILNERKLWLGGSSGVMSAVNWSWSDGTQFAYTNWMKGEPKEGVGALCLVGDTSTHKWSAQSCDDSKAYMCEVPALVDTSYCPTVTGPTCPSPVKCPSCPTLPPTNRECDIGWTYSYTTRKCYKLVYGTPEGAQALCQKESSIVADIHSEAENDWITDFASQSMNGEIRIQKEL